MKSPLLDAVCACICSFGLISTIDAAPVTANLLANPGFETGDFTGWTVGGNADNGVASDGAAISKTIFSDNEVNVHTGSSFAAWVSVSAKSSPAVLFTLSQSVSVLPNTEYGVGFWLSIGSNLSSAGRTYQIMVNDSQILNVDQSGNFGKDFWAGTDPEDYLHERVLYTTGSDEFSVTVEYSLSGSGNELVGFSYDDFHFNVVPVPATFWLFGSGLVGLIGLARYRSV